MNEFEKIVDKMKKQKITPRIHYELMVLRALKAVAAVVVGAGVVWVMLK